MVKWNKEERFKYGDMRFCDDNLLYGGQIRIQRKEKKCFFFYLQIAIQYV